LWKDEKRKERIQKTGDRIQKKRNGIMEEWSKEADRKENSGIEEL
jgi:hypothetical protein